MMPAYLDGLNGILDLIDSALGGERVHTTIVVFFTIHSENQVKDMCGTKIDDSGGRWTYLPIHILDN
jgi:hypothetical protein